MIERSKIDTMIRELASGEGSPTFMSLLDDDTTWLVMGATPWSKPRRGKAIVDELLGPLFRQIQGRYRFHAERVLIDGELLAIEGRGDNLLKSGRRYDNQYVWLMRFAGPRLLELREYMDTNLAMSVLASPSA